MYLSDFLCYEFQESHEASTRLSTISCDNWKVCTLHNDYIQIFFVLIKVTIEVLKMTHFVGSFTKPKLYRRDKKLS